MPATVSVLNGLSEKVSLKKILLTCGIIASLLYVAMNIFVAMMWEGYSSFSQTVSELSAIGAPTRLLWIPLGILYCLLMAAFGWGVRLSADGNRSLSFAGGLMAAYGIIGIFWPPMHLREVLAAGGGTMTDTMHIVFTVVTVILMLLAMGFGAAAFGNLFRLYTIATILTLAVFGGLTGSVASKVHSNLPTPWVGVWERINIGVFLLWVIVLAIVILQKEKLPYSIKDTDV